MNLCDSLVYDPDDDRNRCGSGPFRSTNQNGRSPGVSDPTGNDVADRRRAQIRTYALIVGRLVEDAVRNLRHADDACGSALYIAEPPGPADHVKAPFHDGSARLIGRPDLDEAYAAQDRRRARGEAL